MSASSVTLPYHEHRESVQGSLGATPGQLTVLTLPRLDINQSSQIQQVAKNIVDEANSLLARYSNARLAFSAQDFRSRYISYRVLHLVGDHSFARRL
jgi:hypothetical protein